VLKLNEKPFANLIIKIPNNVVLMWFHKVLIIVFLIQRILTFAKIHTAINYGYVSHFTVNYTVVVYG